MSEHTPERWEHEGDGYIRSTTAPPAGSRICIVLRDIERNAPLIAAAPEMLAALERANPEFGELEDEPDDALFNTLMSVETIRLIRAAIAAATGD